MLAICKTVVNLIDNHRRCRQRLPTNYHHGGGLQSPPQHGLCRHPAQPFFISGGCAPTWRCAFLRPAAPSLHTSYISRAREEEFSARGAWGTERKTGYDGLQRQSLCTAPPTISKMPLATLGHTSHCSWTHQPLLLDTPAIALGIARRRFNVCKPMVSRSPVNGFAFANRRFRVRYPLVCDN